MVELLVVFGDLRLLGVVPGGEDLVELGLGAPLLGVEEPVAVRIGGFKTQGQARSNSHLLGKLNIELSCSEESQL